MGTRPSIIARTFLIAVVFLLLGASPLLASRPSLRAVRITSEGTATVVLLEADAALPAPTVGVLPSPPRIYLDFPGVATVTEGARASGNRQIQGVRVAINQLQPLVTRVVIDLREPMSHSIDAGLRERGRISIVISNPAVQPAAPAPPVPATPLPQPSPAVPGNVPAPVAALPRVAPVAPAPPPSAPRDAGAPPPPAPGAAAGAPASSWMAETRARTFAQFASNTRAVVVRAPEKDVERYLPGALPALEQLENLRPVLVMLDSLSAVPQERLTAVAKEFDAIQRSLAAIEPPKSLQTTHEELRRVCGLGAAAARARLGVTVTDAGAPAFNPPDDATRAWNAAAAAAGAMMLLERARAELGMSRPIEDVPHWP